MDYTRNEAKAWARETLRGYFVTLTTPFDEDLTVDEDGLRANVRRILDMEAAGGIYAGSVYQEFTALTLEEREGITEVVLDAVGGQMPVMVGVSSNCLADTVRLADHASEHGADLVMIWPPTFGNRTTEGVFDFYRATVEQIDIGACVYASSYGDIGFQITPSLLADLAAFDPVCAVKEASMNVGTYFETLERVGDTLVVSMPAEEYWLAGRAVVGPDKTPDVLLGNSRPLYCETPRRTLCSELLGAVSEGDDGRARDAMMAIRGVASDLFTGHHAGGTHDVALTKAITGLAGFATGPVRPPLSAPPQAAVERAREVLVDAGLIPIE